MFKGTGDVNLSDQQFRELDMSDSQLVMRNYLVVLKCFWTFYKNQNIFTKFRIVVK